MAVYDANGTQLNAVYGADGTQLCRAYDEDGNTIYQRQTIIIPTGEYSTQIGYLSDWMINLATYTANSKPYVKERYRMDNWSWVNGATAIAMAQAAWMYLNLWKHTNNSAYLTTARNLVTSLEEGRQQGGEFQMYVYNEGTGYDTAAYTGGNSEVPLYLFRMAELDTDNAQTYITNALKSCDFLLSIQNSNGSWRVASNDQTQTAMFTAQAVGALAMGCKYANSNKRYLYRTAVEKGIAFIQTQLLADNRIRTCREVNQNTEYWRPPTSDQAITIRGLAIAEYYLPNNENVSSWRTLRQTLLTYLNQCIGSEGSARNGLGTTNLPNDFYGLTDHVYTNPWAIEAYYYSALVDDSQSEINISKGIADFCKGNLYFNVGNVNTNGTIRGAYNVQDDNWDTSALTQDSSNEGGAEMIYVGWVTSPICSWMILYNETE